MNTKFFRLALVTVGLATVADAQPTPLPEPAFLEVIPLTFLWHRTLNSSSLSSIGDPTIGEEPTGTEQPVERVTTNVARVRRDTPPGVQGFFVEQLRQAAGFRVGEFEIMAVREPARTMEEFVTTPYRIYITRNSRVRGAINPTLPVDVALVEDYIAPAGEPPLPTGMTITFGPALGRHTENLDSSGNLISISGSVATTFKIEYTSHFRENFDSAIPYHQYNLLASGTVNFNLRRVKVGTRSPATIIPTATRMRGVGSFDHRFYASPDNFFYYVGLSSVDVIMGRAQLLPRERFELPEEDEEDPVAGIPLGG